MSKSGGSSRAAAVRAAHQVQARRAKVLQEREAAIADVLADYFEAKAHSEKIRATAQARAGQLVQAAEAKAARLAAEARLAGERVTEQAQKQAADYDAQVGAAVRRLIEMGEPRAAVAEMTGLSPAVIRSIEREHTPRPGREPQTRPEPAPTARNTRRHSGPVPE